MPRIIDELGIIGLGIETSPHENQLLGQFRELGIERDRERQVSHRTAFINGHRMRIFVDHPNEKRYRAFFRGLAGGRPFLERRNHERRAPPSLVPGAGIGDLSES